MAALLYFILCAVLTGASVRELKTRNRTARIQLYVTLLCALVFCGAFALLVSAARLDGGQYDVPAAVAVLLLTGGTLFALTRIARRFGAIFLAQGNLDRGPGDLCVTRTAAETAHRPHTAAQYR